MWTKLSDEFATHPKVASLGADAAHAILVWFTGACYASRYLTDGYVPAAMVSGIGLTPEQAHAAAEALVRVSLWERAPGGYLFHDWHVCNPSAAETANKRAAQSAGGKLGNQKRWGPAQATTEEKQQVRDMAREAGLTDDQLSDLRMRATGKASSAEFDQADIAMMLAAIVNTTREVYPPGHKDHALSVRVQS